VNRVGEQWSVEFKRIARENGVSDERLKELDDTHLKQRTQEQLMHTTQDTDRHSAEECVDDVTIENWQSSRVLTRTYSQQWQTYAATNSYENLTRWSRRQQTAWTQYTRSHRRQTRTRHRQTASMNRSHVQMAKAPKLSRPHIYMRSTGGGY
jgi:hypothetical protein